MASSEKSTQGKKAGEAGKGKTKTKAKTGSKKGEKEELRRKNNNDKKRKRNNSIVNGNVDESERSPDVESGGEDGEEERAKAVRRKANGNGSTNVKRKRKEKQENGYENGGGEDENEKIHKFPVHRIKTIIRSEDPSLRINQEALFLINKATEKFLQQFCQDGYACVAEDRKKSLAYKHLSSVVSTRKGYDFLSDIVPEKVKAEDALQEWKSAQTQDV